MTKFTTLIMIGLLHTSSALSQSFSSYYKSADGLKKENLKTALSELLQDHTVYTYGSLWDHYPNTDGCIDNEDKVFDMYSTGDYYFSKSPKTYMNKEHVVPQSWWGKGSTYDIYTDLFNVYPSEQSANSAKSNYPLGVVDGTVSFKNERCMVGTSSNSGGADKVFEPCDEFKGDFARIYFYDATCYQDVSWASVASAFPTGGNTYPTLESWIVPMLLEWNRLDPPSEWEKVRNERVYNEQGNRNPFIDYPQLAEYIWGDSTEYVWDVDIAVPYSINGESGNVVVDDGNDDDGNDDDVNETDDVENTLIYSYHFDDLTTGNDYQSGGSSTAWNTPNDSIEEMSYCYMAGGAVRMGTSKKAGSVTTIPLNVKSGSDLVVAVEVKGWTEVEGDINVSVSGISKSYDIEYEATMSDSYQTKYVTIDNISVSNPKITISTSEKRAFLSSILIYKQTQIETEIRNIEQEHSSSYGVTYNMAGQRVDANYKGFVIRNGKKILVR